MAMQAERTARRVVHDIQKLREWVLERIRLEQKSELDGKVRVINVKKLGRVVVSLRRGVGRGLGRALGGLRRAGRSVSRVLGF
jgi:hypothetical protein